MDYPVYCEQPAFGHWFEPLNTMTNLFFVIAGILLLFQLKKKNQLDIKGIYFSILLMIVGWGSFAWHIYRNDTTLMIDSIPIAVFVISYLYFYLVVAAKNILIRILLFLGFFAYTPLIIYLLHDFNNSDILGNGGLEYIVALSYFVLLQIYNLFNNKNIIKKSLVIIILFAISVFFRQTDMIACEKLGFGTHFLWHFFNATVLYLFVRLLYYKKAFNR